MINTWTEFVLINAHGFKSGHHPWTDQEFWYHSIPQSSAPATVDPICIPVTEEPDWDVRVAESDGWWTDGYLQWSLWPLQLDDNFNLTEDVVRFEFEPITTGAFDYDKNMSDPESFLTHEMSDLGTDYVFNDISELMALFNKYNKGKCDLRIMTIWECSAGVSYIPGEPDEWDETWYLIGIVLPTKDGVKYEEI